MAINLSTQFSQKVLDKLSVNSVTHVAFNTNYDYEFIGNETVKIWTIEDAPLNDYDNTNVATSRYGALHDIQDTIQEHKLTENKSTRFVIDNTHNNDQKKIKNASAVMGKWYVNQLMPYKDKLTLTTIATNTPVDHKLTIDLATESIYDKVVEVTELLDEAKAPEAGRVMWATPEGIKHLKLDPNFVGLADLAQRQVKFKGQIGEIDGYPIIKTRKMFMPEDVVAIIAHPSAVATPITFNEAKVVEGGDQVSGSIGVALVRFGAIVFKGREGLLATIKKV